MNLSAAILSDIECIGSTLTVGPDTERPWTVAFCATLKPRTGPTLIGKGKTPSDAISDLSRRIAHATR